MKKTIITLLLFIVSLSLQAQDRPFITEWKIEQDNYKLEFLSRYQLSDYDMTIDWGDGTKDHNTFEHLYQKAGTYHVKISGKYPGIRLSKRSSTKAEMTQPYLVSVLSWGDNKWKTMRFMFACSSLKEIKAKDTPNLKEATTLEACFMACRSFTGNVEDWDVSQVTNLDLMFAGTSFNQDISHWDVSKVTTMRGMFAHAKNFNQPLNQWNVSKVKDMTGMFSNAESFNQPLDRWDVSQDTIIFDMFEDAKSFDPENLPKALQNK